MSKSLLLVPVLVLVAAADSPKGDLKKLQGTWSLVSGQNDGNKIPEDDAKAISLEIKGDKYLVKVRDESIEGTLKLDPTQKPKTIDAARADGETLHGIYELKDDEFRVSLASAGQDRPKDFASGDIIHVWKRARK